MRRIAATLALASALLVACSKAPASTPAPAPQAPTAPAAQAEVPQGSPRKVREVADLSPAPSLPAWSPDGQMLLYVGGEHGLPTVSPVSEQGSPRSLGAIKTFVAPVWAPDGKAVVFAGARPEPDGYPATTLYLQPLAGGDPVDLLPGDLAKQSVSGTKFPRRFVSPTLLAYEEHMGSGIQELRLVDVAAGQPVMLSEPLMATFFDWSPDGALVAGQIYGGPAHFWVWDMAARQYLKPESPLPQAFQFFEGWAGPGVALFTGWDKYPYDKESFTAALYSFDVRSGKVNKLTDDGVLAGGTGNHIVYIRQKPRPTLVVADGAGKPLWQEDLGALPTGPDLWEYRLRLATGYLVYRRFPDEWLLSPLGERRPVPLNKGVPATAGLSPDGRFAVVLVHDVPARIQVFTNPFATK